MVFAADYGGMPDTLLQQIFSCCNLIVRNKLLCQQVCRSWKQCISSTRSAGRKCLWAKRFEIDLSYGAGKSTQLLVDHIESFILMFANSTDDCFISWLARQACNFERMSIKYRSTDTDWRFPSLIGALEYVAASGPELELLELGLSGAAGLTASHYAQTMRKFTMKQLKHSIVFL